MNSWKNGASGGTVKKVIDENFLELGERISQATLVYAWNFKISDWKDGSIKIDYQCYNKQNPSVQLYIKQNSGYEPVLGGYVITNNSVEIYSDIAYDGKVVIR